VGQVEIVNTAEELSAALQHGSSEYTLLGAGDDQLVRGDGDDVIFGDSVHTDALADSKCSYRLQTAPVGECSRNWLD